MRYKRYAARIVPGPTVYVRPDGTYFVERSVRQVADGVTPTTSPPDHAALAVARVALQELAERRERDAIARRLLASAGVL